MTQNVRNENTQTFVINIVSVEFVGWQDRFLKKCDLAAYIINFGYGTARDTQHVKKGLTIKSLSR